MLKNFYLLQLFIILLIFSSCDSHSPIESISDPEIKPLKKSDIFVDQAIQSGIDFIYNTGSTGKLYLAEIVGGGSGLFDCDNDGDLDILFNQGSEISDKFKSQNSQPVLFRNNLTQISNDQLSFTDITQQSGITPGEYGIGVVTADFNNDGNIDFYLTNFGINRLFKNTGNCQFEEVFNQINEKNWSVSASFFDMQNDGLLDLFVGNYVNHSHTYNKKCRNAAGQIDYCGPKAYTPQNNSLWKNIGDSQFENISSSSGIDSSSGGALGVIAADFNGDQKIDIYIANDQFPNYLWQNNSDETFKNTALLSGCAVNSSGLAEASMGVALGDIDNDGQLDLFMTHLRQESNTFFSIKKGMCFDKTNKLNLAVDSLPYTGFGTGFLDIENDGDLDIFIANGEIERIVEQVNQGDTFPLKQKNQLFENNGLGRFTDITHKSGKSINKENVSRGAAFGDIDNDGDIDIIVMNSNEKAQLLINTKGHLKNWIGFDVYNDKYNRNAIGAVIEIIQTNGSKQIRRVATDGSYASANDVRVLFGLGNDDSISSVNIKWLDGKVTHIKNLTSNFYYKIIKSSPYAIKN